MIYEFTFHYVTQLTGYKSEMVTSCEGRNCVWASSTLERESCTGFARANEKVHKGNDWRTRSSSWTPIYNSRCHAEYCSFMVTGEIKKFLWSNFLNLNMMIFCSQLGCFSHTHTHTFRKCCLGRQNYCAIVQIYEIIKRQLSRYSVLVNVLCLVMTKINNVVSIQTYALIQNEGDLDRLDLYTLNMMHLELYLNC